MNQFILGGGDPVLAGTQIDEQIQLLEGQKQLLMARQSMEVLQRDVIPTTTNRYKESYKK